MSQSIQLYVDARMTSPYALSVFVALTEKNLPFTVHTVDLDAQAQHAPEYAALSMTQRVPTLVHGDFALCESSAIDEYLDEVFPDAPMYPKSTEQRALARQVQAWLRSDLTPIRSERDAEVVFYGAKRAPLSEAARRSVDKLIAGVMRLLPANAEHLFGTYSIADTDLAMMLMRLIAHGDAVPEPLRTYALGQWMRPSVQAWVNHANRQGLGSVPAVQCGD